MGERILIVEDDKTTLSAMKFELEHEGYRIEKAEDAWEALCIIERSKIDLIISDILMPNISGLSFLNILKEFYFDKVPVIIMSSLNKKNMIASAIRLGASDFIPKPVNFDELREKIAYLLNTKNKKL